MDVHSDRDFLGFESFHDFFSSFLGIKFWIINAMAAIAGGLVTFITDYVWESSAAVFTLWGLMSFDWITGLTYAIKEGTYWSRKNFRMPIYFVVTSLLLSISWNLSKNSVFFLPLPSVVYGGFCSVYFTSLLENCGKLGWLPPALARLVENRFGFRAFNEKYMKDKDREKKT